MHQKMSFRELPQENNPLKEGSSHLVQQSARIETRGEAAGIKEHQERQQPAQDLKVCPVCGARCFSDMDTCFNCLHSFSRDAGAPESIEGACQCQGKDLLRGFGTESIPSPLDESEFHHKTVGRSEIGVDNPACDGSLPVLLQKEIELDGPQKEEPVASPADASRVLEVIVSITMANDACARNSVASPVVRVETR